MGLWRTVVHRIFSRKHPVKFVLEKLYPPRTGVIGVVGAILISGAILIICV